MVGMRWERPGDINSGRPRNKRDVWADLCGNSHSRGRMSAGQTGQMGHVHGTDGTQTRGCPAKIIYVYWFFLSRSLEAIQRFPGSFPDFPRSSPDLLGSSPDLPEAGHPQRSAPFSGKEKDTLS